MNITNRKFRIRAAETLFCNSYHFIGSIAKDKLFKLYRFKSNTPHLSRSAANVKPCYRGVMQSFYQLYDFFIKYVIIGKCLFDFSVIFT